MGVPVSLFSNIIDFVQLSVSAIIYKYATHLILMSYGMLIEYWSQLPPIGHNYCMCLSNPEYRCSVSTEGLQILSIFILFVLIAAMC